MGVAGWKGEVLSALTLQGESTAAVYRMASPLPCAAVKAPRGQHLSSETLESYQSWTRHPSQEEHFLWQQDSTPACQPREICSA